MFQTATPSLAYMERKMRQNYKDPDSVQTQSMVVVPKPNVVLSKSTVVFFVLSKSVVVFFKSIVRSVKSIFQNDRRSVKSIFQIHRRSVKQIDRRFDRRFVVIDCRLAN